MNNKKLDCIMLIDDNNDDNFYHERVIRKNNSANTVISIESGVEALEYLKNRKDHPDAHPDLIFLDINMPGMNGWEFIEEYKKLDKELTTKIIVTILTTSDHPDETMLAKTHDVISEFRIKPLTKDMLEDIVSKYFAI